MAQRFIGLDLAVTSYHRASVMESDGSFVDNSFSFDRTFEGFSNLLEKALSINDPNCILTFIMEPTNRTWIPLSCFLIGKGHKVYLVNPQSASALRRYYNRFTKSDRIDSRVLAKLPIVDKDNLTELYLPDSMTSALKGYCIQRDRIVNSISARKTRIQSIFTAVCPKLMDCFGKEKFTTVGRAFLRRYSNPFKVQQLGLNRLIEFLKNNCFGQVQPGMAEKIYTACIDAVKIYQDMELKEKLPIDFSQIQDEINMELDLMEFEEKQIKILEEKIENVYKKIDPQGIFKTIKGIGPVHAANIIGITGNINRFPNVKDYQCFCGFVPKKKQSGQCDKPGLSIRKSANYLLKKTYYLGAEVARQWDVEFADFYNRLIKRGLHHTQAICALGRKLSARSYSLLKRIQASKENGISSDISYKLRDTNGRTIMAPEAREIIKTRYPSKRTQTEREKTQIHFKSRQSVDSSKMINKDPLPIGDVVNDMIFKGILQQKNIASRELLTK